MRINGIIRVLVSCVLLIVANGVKAQLNVDNVNMMIGSDGVKKSAYGGTTPAVGTPFAMTQWCAATRVNGISRTMYRYSDKNIIGFMATHQPAIWMGDYGFMTIMPESGQLNIRPEERQAPLDHQLEIAKPYYYKVEYTKNGTEMQRVKTEFTATSHASFFRITYSRKSTAYMYIEAGRENAGGSIEIVPESNEIRVYNREQHDAEKEMYAEIGPEAPNFKGYYVLKFSKPFKTYGTYNNNQLEEGKKNENGSSVGGYVSFDKGTDIVDVRIGSSFISFKQADYNLLQEIPLKASFSQIVKKVKNTWEEKLSKVSIQTDNQDQRTTFYTAMFRTMQYPREFSEYGKYYSAFDGKIHNGISYNDYSLWDTFRAEHPWLQIIAPERVNGMVEGLVHIYEEGGWLPKWPNPSYTAIMIASHADAVIADAYINGFRGYNTEKAYEAVRKDAFVAPDSDLYYMWADRALWHGQYEARGGLAYYLSHGWVASDRTKESVSRTLEFALDDYCIAQMAKAMGKTADYDSLMSHSQNYRNLYNPATKFFQARKTDGKWDTDEEGFTEGAKWTYQFCVMQDVPGLIKLMGGDNNFATLLDENFDGNHYCHINEPGHHYVYLYDYCGHLDKAQKRIPGILKDNYKNSIDGLSGNDDCGQMSAWLIFSSMGFYPVTSASGVYALGIPAYKKLSVDLPSGNKLTVLAPDLGTKETLLDISFNGRKLDKPFINISELMKGGTLVFK
jgi:predicted alpha-1,2-mannosidase